MSDISGIGGRQPTRKTSTTGTQKTTGKQVPKTAGLSSLAETGAILTTSGVPQQEEVSPNQPYLEQPTLDDETAQTLLALVKALVKKSSDQTTVPPEQLKALVAGSTSIDQTAQTLGKQAKKLADDIDPTLLQSLTENPPTQDDIINGTPAGEKALMMLMILMYLTGQEGLETGTEIAKSQQLSQDLATQSSIAAGVKSQEAADKSKTTSTISKVFGWIAVGLLAVVAVVAVAAAVVTGGALLGPALLLGAALLMVTVMVLNETGAMSKMTGALGDGIKKAADALGIDMSQKTADMIAQIAVAVVIVVVMVALIFFSGGTAALGALGAIGPILGTIVNVMTTLNLVGKGVTDLLTGIFGKQQLDAQADKKGFDQQTQNVQYLMDQVATYLQQLMKDMNSALVSGGSDVVQKRFAALATMTKNI